MNCQGTLIVAIPTVQKVAVLGAGAVGSYIIWGLSQKEDIELGVVALKYGALSGAMETIRRIAEENTTVMSLMNGVDSEELICAEIGDSHVIRSLIKVASRREGMGYCFDPETTIGIVFGELAAPYKSERVQAILGAGVGFYQDSVHMKAISDGLKAELEAVAKAKGIDISKADPLLTSLTEFGKADKQGVCGDSEVVKEQEVALLEKRIRQVKRELFVSGVIGLVERTGKS